MRSVCWQRKRPHPVEVLLHELQLLGAQLGDGLGAVAHRRGAVVSTRAHPLAPDILPDAIQILHASTLKRFFCVKEKVLGKASEAPSCRTQTREKDIYGPANAVYSCMIALRLTATSGSVSALLTTRYTCARLGAARLLVNFQAEAACDEHWQHGSKMC